MQYRKANTEGGTYFFTVVTGHRRKFLCTPENVSLLREAFRYVMAKHSFQIDAFVLLPDHLHCMWRLPDGDSNFSARWRLIKGYFTRHCDPDFLGHRSASRLSKQEQAVWQRRCWEHQIRDEEDFRHHVEYIHYNPVKHGLAKAPKNWPFSSFRRYVRRGTYVAEWGEGTEVVFGADVGSE